MKWQRTSLPFSGKPHEQYEKAKAITLEDESAAPGQKISTMLLMKDGGQLLIALERIKWLDQSRNGTQFWMCLML